VVTSPDERLPHRVLWQQRPFPDANLLLLREDTPALVDSNTAPFDRYPLGSAFKPVPR
jgi:hypothetical protein